jgi:GTP-binding protein Era
MRSPPDTEPNGPPRAGRVALIGRPNVGKSTLLNAVVGQPLAITSPHPQTTRDAVRGVLTDGETQYLFVDTPGVHTPRNRLGHLMNDVAWQYAREADAVVLVTEAAGPAAEGSRRAEARPHPGDLAIAAELPKMPIVLVINKVDRLPDKAALLPLLAAFAEARTFPAIVPLSARREGAKTSTRPGGVTRLLHELRALLPEQPFLFDPETLSDQPERFFVAELVREQILRHTRQEIPHGVAVVVERIEERARPRLVVATIHVAREAHKKILIGAGGQMLKSIGTAARARVERILGVHVRLELRVHASPDWMNDDGRLREFGYGRQDP